MLYLLNDDLIEPLQIDDNSINASQTILSIITRMIQKKNNFKQVMY